MNRVLFATAAAAALAMPLAASSASAEIVDVTYTGTVQANSYDVTGVFGLPYNTDMGGMSYTARYVFDTTVGKVFSSPDENYALGGSLYGFPSPALSATLTINNVTVSIGVPNWNAEILGSNAVSCCSATSSQYSTAEHMAGSLESGSTLYTDNNVYNQITSNTANLPASITTPFTYTVDPSTDDSSYNFQFLTENPSTDASSVYAFGSFVANTVTLSLPTAVPEPSTWALMLAGFAGLGFAAYRKGRPAIPIA